MRGSTIPLSYHYCKHSGYVGEGASVHKNLHSRLGAAGGRWCVCVEGEGVWLDRDPRDPKKCIAHNKTCTAQRPDLLRDRLNVPLSFGENCSC